jgi:hypothetical protein
MTFPVSSGEIKTARQSGSSPAEAVTAANRYMEEVLHVPPR